VPLAVAYAADAGYYCEACIPAVAAEAEVEARAFAREYCRVTRPLPPYDPAREYRCTPEEYASGNRESYTRSAHACYCRHECTNYDELVRGLDRPSVTDQILYAAIRERIKELLEEAREADLLGDDPPDEDDEGAGWEV
jgi:hypothetical protein